MPTYDYVCDRCNDEFEIFQSMKDKPKRKCPSCGALALRRRIGAGAGVIFKGSGFFQTDYRSSEYKKQAKAERNSDAAANGSAQKKSTDVSLNRKTPCGPSCRCAGGD
ncbi:MAG: zinc ribbon domain-containing protein [Planctomycetota bacterium]|nr:MAG: zinc ribbon domain-containing protein [Planctomycetota bacterium]